METVKSLESTVAGWYKDVPHLPADARKWIANNLWWLTIVGLVLSAFALLSTIGALLLVLGLSGTAIGAAGMYGSPVAGGVIGAAWVGTLVVLVSLAATLVLLGMAVSPLKVKAKKGWTLLFVVLLLNLALNVIGSLLVFNVIGLLMGVLWAGIEAYFLFEIRSEFGHAAKPIAPKAK